MFVLLNNNEILEDVTDIINTPTGSIIVTGSSNQLVASTSILTISTIYPSKDALSCLVDT